MLKLIKSRIWAPTFSVIQNVSTTRNLCSNIVSNITKSLENKPLEKSRVIQQMNVYRSPGLLQQSFHSQTPSFRGFHVLPSNNQELLSTGIQANPFQKFSLAGSTSVRFGGRYDCFPRPSEIKRIKKHGWKTRMKTRGGREIIMRRILKGRHCLTH